MQNEVKKLRKSLDEAVQTRDLYNVSLSFLGFLGANLLLLYCFSKGTVYYTFCVSLFLGAVGRKQCFVGENVD